MVSHLAPSPPPPQSRSGPEADAIYWITRHPCFRRLEVVDFAPGGGYLFLLTLEDRSYQDTYAGIVDWAASYLRRRDAEVR